VISAIITSIPFQEVTLTFDQPFTTGPSPDMEGTGGTVDPSDVWNDDGNYTADTAQIILQAINPWLPGAAAEITQALDFDFSPAILTLPLAFTIAP